MAKQTFTTWLGKQEHRQDPVGHLARVWAEFTPGRISSVAGVNRVLREIAERDADGPVPAALEAMTAAVDEYEHRDDPRPPLAAVPDAGPNRVDDEGAEPPGYALVSDKYPGMPAMPLNDAQGRYDGASALAHQVTPLPAGVHVPPGQHAAAARAWEIHQQGARFPAEQQIPVPAEHASADGYSRSRPDPTRWQVTSAPQGTLERIAASIDSLREDVLLTLRTAMPAEHLPAIRRALEFALSVARPEHAGEYSGALAALFPADYGTQDPDMLADLEQATAPPAPDDFAGLWAAADFSEADR